jgi:DNA-binding NarL/FixJ family response regulator
VLAGAAARARAEHGYHGNAATASGGLADGPPDPAMDLPGAIALAQRARGPRRRPSTGWDSLTPTEQSVVELAARGLSNPDIAARLYVSRGTVKTHLAHVYAKLGVANRTDLTRLVTLRARSE